MAKHYMTSFYQGSDQLTNTSAQLKEPLIAGQERTFYLSVRIFEELVER
jgi:hypothetical protein